MNLDSGHGGASRLKKKIKKTEKSMFMKTETENYSIALILGSVKIDNDQINHNIMMIGPNYLPNELDYHVPTICFSSSCKDSLVFAEIYFKFGSPVFCSPTLSKPSKRLTYHTHHK